MIAQIASRVRETLLAEAAKAAPNEACGLLLGCAGAIEAAVPAANVAAHPENTFEIDPAVLLRTHREARKQGQQVIGHYHSHPDDSAEPSLRDAARATENGQLWLIVAAGEIHAWHVTPGRSALHGRFLPVALHTDVLPAILDTGVPPAPVA